MKTYITGNTYPVKDKLKSLGCRWDGQRKAWYTESDDVAIKAKAIVEPHPIYNSPPPADLGTADPVVLAAAHGRKAIEGAKVMSFSCYGLDKGDNGDPNGSIRRVRGVRYVQVARTARRYMSRDMLEDFDLFTVEPGGSYQWDGVAVEPTDEERAADAKAKAAKDAKLGAPKAWQAAVALIDQTVAARPQWVSETTRVATWHEPVMCHTGSYPVIHIGETEVYYHVPSYFACDMDYDAVHRVAPLTDDLLAQILAAVESCKQYGLIKTGGAR